MAFRGGDWVREARFLASLIPLSAGSPTSRVCSCPFHPVPIPGWFWPLPGKCLIFAPSSAFSPELSGCTHCSPRPLCCTLVEIHRPPKTCSLGHSPLSPLLLYPVSGSLTSLHQASTTAHGTCTSSSGLPQPEAQASGFAHPRDPLGTTFYPFSKLSQVRTLLSGTARILLPGA